MYLLEPFLKFDKKMVDILESLCHRQQRFLGTNHYFWLKLFAIAHAAFTFVFLLPTSKPAEYYECWILIAAFLICLPALTWWETRSLTRLLKGYANPLRKDEKAIFVRYLIGYVGTTYIIVGMTVAAVIDFKAIWVSLAIALWWTTVASLYVLPVCDPLPPVTGKWKEWLAKVFLRPALS